MERRLLWPWKLILVAFGCAPRRNLIMLAAEDTIKRKNFNFLSLNCIARPQNSELMKFLECAWNLLEVNHVTYCPRWFSWFFLISSTTKSQQLTDEGFMNQNSCLPDRKTATIAAGILRNFLFSPPKRSNLYYFENIWSAFAINSRIGCSPGIVIFKANILIENCYLSTQPTEN